MKLNLAPRKLLALVVGVALSAAAADAQLLVNTREQGTFGPFVGGSNNNVTNNGTFNTTEVITTGLPIADPFSITYNPIVGPSLVTLGTGTLDTATFMFHSPTSPSSTFTSVAAVLNFDFDNNGSIDLTQNYTINLTPFTAPNGLTGINYSIIPQQFFGSVLINGQTYGYASAVANSSGGLFDGQNTTSTLQFQFVATPVPEPSTYAIAGVAALVGIAAVGRRKNSASGAGHHSLQLA